MAEMNELLLKSVTGNIPGVIFVLDKEGIFTLSDGKGLAKLGLQPGQVVGRSAFEVYKDSPEICESIRSALQGDEHHSSTQVGEALFETWTVPTRDEQGQINGVLGLANDVTDRTRAEAAIRESEEQQRQILEASPVATIITKISDGAVLYANEEAGKLFKEDAHFLAGKTALSFFDDPNERRGLLKALQETGYVRNKETRFKRSDGETFWAP
jgi:PAS domain S-box-containing protein